MKQTLFELKEKMHTLANQIAADADWIAEKVADPAVAMDEINTKKAHRDEVQERYNEIKKLADEMEEQQRNSVAMKSGDFSGTSKEEVMLKAKAAFYRTALTGGDMNEVYKAYEGLGAIPENVADLGYGENLLPHTLETALIVEPFETNSLREIEQVSQITGLEEPKLLFSIEDADLADITDEQTAKEIEMEGDTIEYGRFKTKIVATIKDTVMHGTQTDLVSQVENGLRSGLAQKEKMRAFDTAADENHAHMSFYMNSIVAVPGDDIISAIINAYGDLADSFSENARCVMRRKDYYAAIRTLSNGADNLWGKKPEDVIGIPVVFNDRAIIPVVGDFRYARLNYDLGTIYETDKDAKKGEYYFVLTAWGDHRIKLKSAFRTAYVRVMIVGAVATAESTPAAAGDDLTAVGVFNDGGEGAGGTVAYEWQYLNGTDWAAAAAWSGYQTATVTTVNNQDEGVSFRCKVSYVDADGDSTVAYTAPITLV